MARKYIFLIYVLVIFMGLGNHLFAFSSSEIWHGWKGNQLVDPTERKPARTAVLVVVVPGNWEKSKPPIHARLALGKNTWQRYMNSHPNVDCYFMKCASPKEKNFGSSDVFLEGNTIFVKDTIYNPEHGADDILFKTIKSIEWLLTSKKYTHFIRTTLNTFFDLKRVNDYMET